MKPQQRQLRLQNCLQTILEVHEFMGGKAVNLEIAHQLQNLKELITHFQPEAITDQDLEKIEESTNHLLRELAKIFYIKKLGFLRQGYYH
ncbi:MAG: hypothetical protein AB1585_22010 [Thermodesulfobacteriota bacterium]